jgi:hypothetical protein
VTTKAMIAAQDHGMVLVGNQPLLTMGESCPGGIPSPWKTNGWVLVGFRLPTFERKLWPTGPASAGKALLARSSWQINSWGSLLPPQPLHY